MRKKYETKKFVEKKLPIMLKGYWEKLNYESKKEMIDEATEMFHEEWQDMEEVFNTIKNRRETYFALFLGVMLGIVGGLLSNIIHTILLQYGTIYYISSVVAFLVLIVFVIKFVQDKDNSTIRSNKTLLSFLKVVKEREKNRE